MSYEPARGAPDQPVGAPPGGAPASVSNQGGAAALSDSINGLVVWIARHWLALFNIAWGAYVILPFLAPLLMQAGYTTPARVIYG
ncbi:MAG TPA: hypothetical protein VNK95_14845, partial [Caldilineaceae bacterium]|nr:hypothetical protein [Caldilineaceae bacterium]